MHLKHFIIGALLTSVASAFRLGRQRVHGELEAGSEAQALATARLEMIARAELAFMRIGANLTNDEWKPAKKMMIKAAKRKAKKKLKKSDFYDEATEFVDTLLKYFEDLKNGVTEGLAEIANAFKELTDGLKKAAFDGLVDVLDFVVGDTSFERLGTTFTAQNYFLNQMKFALTE